MSDWYRDVYGSPDKYGLTLVAELDDPEADYSFDILAVWQHTESGRLYYATDSGCSCPSPFEDFKSIESLTEITDATWATFQADVENHCAPDQYTSKSSKRRSGEFAADKTQLVEKVHNLLRAAA